jgi:hypothetical protein
MKDRGSLFVGLLLLLFGALFLLVELGGSVLGAVGLHFGWDRAWPFIILMVALAFWLPIGLWWDRRRELAGVAIPGTIVGTLGLILLYQRLTGDWGSWAYLWALMPVAVGLGLLAMYGLGHRSQGLLLAATIVGGIGLFFLAVFGSIFGGVIRIIGPVALIAIGLIVMMHAVRGRQGAGRWPEK